MAWTCKCVACKGGGERVARFWTDSVAADANFTREELGRNGSVGGWKYTDHKQLSLRLRVG